MRPIHTFTVVPALPPALEPLRTLATNLRWGWDHDTIELFRRLGGDLWEESGRNPVRLLSMVDQSRLEDAAEDGEFLAHLDRVSRALEAYLDAEYTWYRRTHGGADGARVAYFSAEFGVTDCVSIFAGGLGMLAGDHLKSASDLGVPLVGVGVLYQQGYFEQRLNEAGWQQEVPAANDFHQLPLTLERDPDGEPLTVELGFPDGPLAIQVWRAQVGRVPLYLLDANVPANTPDQRRVTDSLYGGDEEMRIRQEIVLGIGGYRALEALGHTPEVFHMNEGHSAFLALERIRRLMDDTGASFAEAREAASASLVFTTHTPVSAGHDYFTPELLERYFGVYVKSLGYDFDDFVGLGRENPSNVDELFCMTILALRLSARANAVSRLHGEVSRAMWQGLWPDLPTHEIPIGHVTNGVHLPSWTSREVSDLYDRYLDGHWRDEPSDETVWRRVDDISAEELWRIHEVRRQKLVDFVRRRLRLQAERRGADALALAEAEEALDPRALTIGFARRFATYKRATLVAHDRDRLARIFSDPERPVQLVVAGKAHPRDDAGKEFIRRIFELSREEPFRGRIVFVEDYNMAVARYLVGGADVWLNNPIRPLEASGTSGMKAGANGVLNCSTLDGWWDEAWRDLSGEGTVPFGWAIGRGETYQDPSEQDRIEALAFYGLLEHDIVPTFYDRGDDGLPRGWIARMTASVARLSPCFNTHRMLREYTDTIYVPAATATAELSADGLRRSRTLAAWRSRVRETWPEVAVVEVADGAGDGTELRVGEELRPRAVVDLAGLAPDDVTVELYVGRLDADGQIAAGHALPMEHSSRRRSGQHVYEAVSVRPSDSGRYGYAIRVRPHHADLPERFLAGCLTWAAPD